MNYKLIAYAQDFASFLIQNIKRADKIKKIILFGSTSRGEEVKESDIDIFIETEEKQEQEINKIKENFYESIKFKKYWELFGIKNEINLSIGNLKDWGDLNRSIISNGIILYGKYIDKIKTNPHVLFSISPGKDRNKNISIWRELYGYTQKVGKKEYIKEGLIKEYQGEKLANGVVIIPIDNSNKLSNFLKNNKFKFKIVPFWMEG
ncbi:MAG: nucleotidyltransferase domain-containing protein [Candidatus Pacearchaeota archaeon]|jgi:predicted nucleotidyltransferase